ncbi:MAG TPA: ABC transporter ATP-binding protein [Spirochaetia bacterium]|nr:ABC transporter ATP-binding protein [Spirochaetia bacterium]
MADSDVLLSVVDLRTHFTLHEGTVKAVDGVSFDVKRKQTLGVIGESGSGKSVTAQSVLRIVPDPGRIVTGRILFHAHNGDALDLAALDPMGQEIRRIRGKDVAMVFQEPMTSFGPLSTIGHQITETILLHGMASSLHEAREQTVELLDKVGIARPRVIVDCYPHQLSGGMRQRAMIAMALSCRPLLLIADEPTTALDVTIQAQILDLMQKMQDEFAMSILYITHNLAVVSEIADEVVVMYFGKVMERGSTRELFTNPLHPYTQALWRSIPTIDGPRTRLNTIAGMMPKPYEVPRGCVFFGRCPVGVEGVCNAAPPPVVEVAPGHAVHCVKAAGK